MYSTTGLQKCFSVTVSRDMFSQAKLDESMFGRLKRTYEFTEVFPALSKDPLIYLGFLEDGAFDTVIDKSDIRNLMK